MMGERYEEREGFVVILRPLKLSEIQKLADLTAELRGQPRPADGEDGRQDQRHALPAVPDEASHAAGRAQAEKEKGC